MYLSDARHNIERINIDFLCSNFKLKRADHSLGPDRFRFDLIAEDNIFELKSRTYPKNGSGERVRYQSDFEWWQLEVQQIREYEKWTKSRHYNLYWILLRGDSTINPTKMKTMNQSTILNRDIFLLPWNSYKLVPQNGRYYYLGLRKVKANYNFKTTKIKKGILHIEQSIEPILSKYFISKP